MTPEEILKNLRDIHLPETTGGGASIDLVLWPLALVLLAAVVVLWLILQRRSRWRREFVESLDRIERSAQTEGAGDGWRRLAVLMKQLALHHWGPSDVAGLSGDLWLRRLDELIGVDLFTKGPGRGLAIFPYLGSGLDDETSRRMQRDLDATLKKLRNHHPGRGTAR